MVHLTCLEILSCAMSYSVEMSPFNPPSDMCVVMREKTVFTSWKVFLFPLLSIDAAKSIMNLYKSSRFNVRTEDTEISFRIQNFLPLSQPPSNTQAGVTGWRQEWYTSAPAEPRHSCWRSEHNLTTWHSTESELGEICCPCTSKGHDTKPRPTPPQLRNWAWVLYPPGVGAPHPGKFLNGLNSSQTTGFLYRLGSMKEIRS